MFLTIQTDDQNYRINLENPLDISIPLKFNGAQPNAYGVEKASAEPCRAGEIVGDTRLGGSVNFEQVKLIPHCNGTHTESVGHITRKRISVRECLKDALVLSNLISVSPEKASETRETYRAVKLSGEDKLITRAAIEKALENVKRKIENGKLKTENLSGLVVRTLPNDESKLSKTYLEEIPPFFSTEAMRLFREIGIKHLLCDLPSIDRIFDDGKLSNHRAFWNIEEGSFDLKNDSFLNKTITELIYAPENVKDGAYLLNLQIAPFEADASPSRPLLFEILREG